MKLSHRLLITDNSARWRKLYASLASGTTLNLIGAAFEEAEITPGGYLRKADEESVVTPVEVTAAGYVSREAFRRSGRPVTLTINGWTATGYRLRIDPDGFTWIECAGEEGGCRACLHEADKCGGVNGRCYFCILDRHDSEECGDDPADCLFCALDAHEDGECDPDTCVFCLAATTAA